MLRVSALASPPLRDSDGSFVRRARGGDLGAFATLVERYREVTVRVCSRIVGAEDAEDVAQDAFLRAFGRLAKLRDDEGFRPWLLRIAHNASLDHLRRRRGEPSRESLDAEHADAVETHDRPPARLIEDAERRERLGTKLALLRDEHRVVLVLRDLEGLPYDEIAEVTGMPLGSVKGRLHRARAELVDLLRRNAYDWELPDGG